MSDRHALEHASRKIDVSTRCVDNLTEVLGFRLTLLRSFTYAEEVRDNTPGFKYIAGCSFAAALALQMLLMLLGSANVRSPGSQHRQEMYKKDAQAHECSDKR